MKTLIVAALLTSMASFAFAHDKALGDNPELYGSVTTRGAVDFRGTVDIYYRKASPALTTPFQPSIFTLDRIAYSEW